MAAADVLPSSGRACAGLSINGTQSSSRSRWLWWLPSWKPSSEERLDQAESAVIRTHVQTEHTDSYVFTGSDAYIRTISFEPTQSSEPERLPLVLIHGFGTGFLQYYKNLDHLHSKRRVLALDLPGFARSSRVPFSTDAERIEEEFAERIEQWREGIGEEKVILLGHSMGGYIASTYAMRYPSRVRHLILVDPWGVTEPPPREELEAKYPAWARLFFQVAASVKPFDPIRAAGPWGPNLLARTRSDLGRQFGSEFLQYVYHCNMQRPTGETAFSNLQHNYAWAHRPLIPRIGTELDPSLPLTLITGEDSWMRRICADLEDKVVGSRPDSYVKVHVVEGAGHHVHCNKPEEFNDIVNGVCALVDSGEDITRGRESTWQSEHLSSEPLAAQ